MIFYGCFSIINWTKSCEELWFNSGSSPYNSAEPNVCDQVGPSIPLLLRTNWNTRQPLKCDYKTWLKSRTPRDPPPQWKNIVTLVMMAGGTYSLLYLKPEFLFFPSPHISQSPWWIDFTPTHMSHELLIAYAIVLNPDPSVEYGSGFGIEPNTNR